MIGKIIHTKHICKLEYRVTRVAMLLGSILTLVEHSNSNQDSLSCSNISILKIMNPLFLGIPLYLYQCKWWGCNDGGPTLSGVPSPFENHSRNMCLVHCLGWSLQQSMCGPLLSPSDITIAIIPCDQCHTLENMLGWERIHKYCDSSAIYLRQVLSKPLWVKISLAGVVGPNETPRGDSRLNKLGQTRHPSTTGPSLLTIGPSEFDQ